MFKTLIAEENKRINQYGKNGIPGRYVLSYMHEDEIIDLTKNFAYYMHDNNMRPFHALDLWLYYSLSGDYSQIGYIHGMIECSAVYDNYYEGIIAFDITKLLLSTNRKTLKAFIRLITSKEISDHATLLIFFNENATKQGISLINEIAKNAECNVIRPKLNDRGENNEKRQVC